MPLGMVRSPCPDLDQRPHQSQDPGHVLGHVPGRMTLSFHEVVFRVPGNLNCVQERAGDAMHGVHNFYNRFRTFHVAAPSSWSCLPARVLLALIARVYAGNLRLVASQTLQAAAVIL